MTEDVLVASNNKSNPNWLIVKNPEAEETAGAVRSGFSRVSRSLGESLSMSF